MLDLKCQLPYFLLFSLCSLLFSSSCALPRIIVLEDPLTAEEHLSLGVAYEKRGEFDSAIKEYRLAAKKLPIAYLHLGNSHFQKNELHEAEESYKEAVMTTGRAGGLRRPPGRGHGLDSSSNCARRSPVFCCW
ncbi:MAG: tetratricopeptide repeat protein [Deltaproteobacteria bacterium]|nr:tetratricopeptide repeat protein [Deltaproteobacteria bacterium]